MAKKMDQEIKIRWTSRLREPSRKQGKNKLRDEFGNQCCLDVLCEIAVEDGVIDPPERQGDAFYYGYEDLFLPRAVREWAGLDDRHPQVLWKESGVYGLADLNDSMGLKFPELADIIDEQL